MAQRHYSSTAAAMQLQGSVNGSSATLTVDAVVGLPVSYPFTVVIDPGTELEEIVTVTNVAGTTLTVVRGEDGTAGVPHSGGAVIRHMVTARDLREPQQHIAATSDVHGVTGSIASRLEALEALINNVIPVGGLLPHTGDPNNVPAGFYLADGSSLLRADEPALYAVIGTTYGEGDDPGNTFALPKMDGRTPVGVDANDSDFNARGKTFGAKTHTLTISQMPSHNHGGSTGSGGGGSTGSGGSGTTGGSGTLTTNSRTPDYRWYPSAGGGNHGAIAGSGSASQAPIPHASHNHTIPSHNHSIPNHSHSIPNHTHSISSQGGGAAHNNVQPSIALPYIIKA